MTYIPSQHKLIIFEEYHCQKQSNEQTVEELKKRGITGNDLIIAKYPKKK